VAVAYVSLKEPAAAEERVEMRRRFLVAVAAASLMLAPAARASISGIDVSHYNGTIDWSRVAAAGYRFAFAKATEGSFLNDAPYATYRAGAAAMRMKFGAYHFARPGGTTTPEIEVSAVAQADHFLQVAQPRAGDLFPVLDLEATGSLSPSQLSIWAWSWLRETQAKLHVKAIIYASPHFWETALSNTSAFAAAGYRMLWVAHYTSAPAPTVPAQNWGGYGWTFWQWADCGAVPGITGCVDKDRFNGTSFAAVTIPAPPANTSPPTITGGAAAGQTLTASTGTWTGTPPLTFSFQWSRCDPAGAGCAPIAGAVAQTYTTAAVDIGHSLIVTVTAKNARASAAATSGPTAVIADTTPPSVPRFSAPAAPFERKAALAVAWHSTDLGDGVAGYDVRYRSAPTNGDFGAYVAWRSATSETSSGLVGVPGTTYCFSARAGDRAGNESGWSDETCTAAPLDDRALARRSGRWRRATARGYYHGTYSLAAVSGASLVRSGVQAKRLALLATRCPTCGTVQVFWNGVLRKRVALTAARLEKRQLVELMAFPAAETGTVRIRVASSARPVFIDGLGASRT
jgi:GH25 family lysozyme M1 (1,4-beta-N-acetylmuramidase)